jgi:hypothetical protein
MWISTTSPRSPCDQGAGVRNEAAALVIRVPQITLKSIKAGAKKLEERGQEPEQRGEDLSRRMSVEIQLLLASSVGPAAAKIGELHQQTLGEFNDAIAALEKKPSPI